jgi:hypothetical protein
MLHRLRRRSRLRDTRKQGDVRTGAETPPGPGHDHHLHLRVAADLDERRIQLLYGHGVERVEFVGAIQCHDRNAAGVPGNSDHRVL